MKSKFLPCASFLWSTAGFPWFSAFGLIGTLMSLAWFLRCPCAGCLGKWKCQKRAMDVRHWCIACDLESDIDGSVVSRKSLQNAEDDGVMGCPEHQGIRKLGLSCQFWVSQRLRIQRGPSRAPGGEVLPTSAHMWAHMARWLVLSQPVKGLMKKEAKSSTSAWFWVEGWHLYHRHLEIKSEMCGCL